MQASADGKDAPDLTAKGITLFPDCRVFYCVLLPTE